jgi:CHAT domain-containing protein
MNFTAQFLNARMRLCLFSTAAFLLISVATTHAIDDANNATTSQDEKKEKWKLSDGYVSPDLLAPGEYSETPYPESFRNDGLGELKSKPFVSGYYPSDGSAQRLMKNFLPALEAQPKDINTLQRVIAMLASGAQYHRVVPFCDRLVAAGGKPDIGMRICYAFGLNRVGRQAEAIKLYEACLSENRVMASKQAGSFYFEVFLYTWLMDRDFQGMLRIFVQAQDYYMSKFERYSMHEDIFETLKRAYYNKELAKFLPGTDPIWKFYGYHQLREMVQLIQKSGLTPTDALLAASDPLFNGQPVHPKILRERSELAFDNGDSDLALKLAERALELSSDAWEQYLSRLTLTRVYRQREELEKALDVATRLYQDYRNGGDKGKAGTVAQVLALTDMRLANYREAVELFDESLSLIQDPNLAIHHRRADALSQTSRAAEAEPILREYADNTYRRHDVSEIHPVHLAWGSCLNNLGRFEEALKALKVVLEPMKLIGDNYKVDASTLIAGHVESGRAYLGLKKFREAEAEFGAAESGSTKSENKSAWWKWQLGKASARLGQNDAKSARQLVDSALENIEAQRASLSDFKHRRTLNDNKYGVYELAIQLALAENDHDRAFQLAERARARTFLDELGAKSAAAQTFPLATMADLQKECRDFNVVAFFQTQQSLLAWVINANKSEMIELPISTTEVQKMVEDLLRAIYSRSSLLQNSWKDSGKSKLELEASRDLYQKLWSPIEAKLTPGSRICIIPHQVLHYVPFQALNDGKKYLIESHELFYAPSASGLLSIRQRKIAQTQKIAVFDSVLSLDPQSGFSKTETLALQQQFPKADFFIREQATTKSFKEHAVESGIIHVSSHGSFNAWIPVRSALYLSSGDKKQPEALSAEDVYSLKFAKTNLIVMSACVSSVGDLAGGDEVTGLTRAFQVAGINNVIGSLWPVENEATTHLMTMFYKELAKNFDDPVAALCKAQRAALDTPSLSKWAAFQVTGSGFKSNK